MINLLGAQPGPATNITQERVNADSSVRSAPQPQRVALNSEPAAIPAVLVSVTPSESLNQTDARGDAASSSEQSSRLEAAPPPGKLSKEERAVVQELSARDREVRQHELAHKAAAGSLAGAMSFTYQRGPDGRLYAVGGEVSIQRPGGNKTPEEALREAESLLRAATAPAEPSGQDLRVAAQARQEIVQLRAEIQAERFDQNDQGDDVAGIDPTGQTQETESEEETRTTLSSQTEQDSDEDSSEEDQVDFFEEAQARRESTAQALEEYQIRLAEIQQQLAEVNQKLTELGVLEALNYEPGNLVNEET